MAVSIVLCGLNSLKPPVIDDTAYLAYGRQIASKPLDPYGFEFFWYQRPQPAFTILVPPVLPYWLGLGIRLWGYDTLLLKFWLWPWCLLFCLSLLDILKRYAAGIEAPILALVALSPAILPGINFMIDFPALTLSLSAIALMLRAADGDSAGLAVLAGIVAGLGMETKYTGFSAPAICALIPIVQRRSVRLSFAVGLAALAVFGGWELLMAKWYGSSHFQFHATRKAEGTIRKINLIVPFVMLVGAIGAGLIPLAMAAFGCSRRIVALAGAMVIGLYLLLAMLPSEFTTRLGSPETLLFESLGAIVLAMLVWSIGRYSRSMSWFLLVWLAIEIGAYFTLTPWPAARRVYGTFLAATLVLANAIAANRDRPIARTSAWLAAGCSAILGLTYFATDLANARAELATVREVGKWIGEQSPNADVWFAGHWGFMEYAQDLGWKAIDFGNEPKRADSWVIAPDRIDDVQLFNRPKEENLARTFGEPSLLPLRTNPTYYANKFPIERLHEPPMRLKVYRWGK